MLLNLEPLDLIIRSATASDFAQFSQGMPTIFVGPFEPTMTVTHAKVTVTTSTSLSLLYSEPLTRSHRARIDECGSRRVNVLVDSPKLIQITIGFQFENDLNAPVNKCSQCCLFQAWFVF